ncbi:Sugar transferase involved in LPS biosynthesis (colanic, teichoic acid) [Cyclobacterium lianum]|uniref:Sugar transferase involved in LPS biosynthesis (Colanic, teichoic acid) n=2 Tax=Cyclobacterium lianum TaxID=388280 RepID=A0A1M7PET5_9BACT|nr:Sugar transferase involved in LPS biosynthesis (colanic, teichoic acid) [Cyclobacterium lianum]
MMGKRIFDFLAALFLLLVLSPLILVLFFLIWSRRQGPVLFRQTRTGQYGRPFTLLKFRTMTDERDSIGRLLPDEERFTRLGRWMRQNSLDELPQLFCILAGKMSLVGPRPLLPEYLPLYSAAQNRRHEVLPGITGLAQAKGRNSLRWEDKFRFDTWYVNHRTFILDLWILFLTIRPLIRQEHIYPSDSRSVIPFRGNKQSA